MVQLCSAHRFEVIWLEGRRPGSRVYIWYLDAGWEWPWRRARRWNDGERQMNERKQQKHHLEKSNTMLQSLKLCLMKRRHASIVKPLCMFDKQHHTTVFHVRQDKALHAITALTVNDTLCWPVELVASYAVSVPDTLLLVESMSVFAESLLRPRGRKVTRFLLYHSIQRSNGHLRCYRD